MNSIRVVALAEVPLDDVVRIHMDAFAGYMNTRLGAEYVRAFLKWFASRPESIALASIDCDGRVTGYVIGAFLGWARTFAKDLLVHAALGVVRHPSLLLEAPFRRAAIRRIAGMLVDATSAATAPSLPEPTIALVGIAVESAARGAGYGKAMLTRFELEARARSGGAMQLAVHSENQTARRIYESIGWRPVDPQVTPCQAMYYAKVLR